MAIASAAAAPNNVLRDGMGVLGRVALVRRLTRYGTVSTRRPRSRSLILSTTHDCRPPGWRVDAIFVLARALNDPALVQQRSRPAGFGNSSPYHCSMLPRSSVTSKKSCGCGFA
jgi:hypothetical protein